MPKFRFTIREVLTWTTWLALYLAVRRTLLLKNGRFDIQQIWIEAHLAVIWSAVAIDRFFRPEIRGRKMLMRGMTIGALGGVIFTVESLVEIVRVIRDLQLRLPNIVLDTALFFAENIVAGAIFGFFAVLFYSFLTHRRDAPSPPDAPPHQPTALPDNRSSHHDRAPS